jgi:hypothetical protein
MVYSRGGIPVGDYNADRIVNLGNNGFGYTYFNEVTGFEFSAVSALTYNFRNPHTDYQNGIDWHTDLEASRFLYKRFFVGAVGYYFNQLTGDSGSGATLGPYLTRIAAVGPEVGVLFPVGELQGSLSLRWEFAAQNRSSGWNNWLAFSIAPVDKTPKLTK